MRSSRRARSGREACGDELLEPFPRGLNVLGSITASGIEELGKVVAVASAPRHERRLLLVELRCGPLPQQDLVRTPQQHLLRRASRLEQRLQVQHGPRLVHELHKSETRRGRKLAALAQLDRVGQARNHDLEVLADLRIPEAATLSGR
jgi:hypothetical protein